MEIRIFNVDHGSCALVISDADPFGDVNVALLDCGAELGGFRPSEHLWDEGFARVDHLIISHFDEDHLTDLPNLLALGEHLPIVNVHYNSTMTPDQIWEMKARQGPIGPGAASIIQMLLTWTAVRSGDALAARPLLGFDMQTFRIPYPVFTQPNDLSLVTFLHHRAVSIIFPGDIGTAGWRILLQNPQFRANLARVNVFVTSHLGREDGYCPELFIVRRPDIFIRSDTNLRYATQEQDYEPHATGVPFLPTLGPRRCLTTRHDGHIQITPRVDGSYMITTGVRF